MSVQIQLRRGNSSDWTTANPLLAQGEVGIELNTGLSKIGDGILSWNNLSYNSASYALNGGVAIDSSSLSASYLQNSNITIDGDGNIKTSGSIDTDGTPITSNGGSINTVTGNLTAGTIDTTALFSFNPTMGLMTTGAGDINTGGGNIDLVGGGITGSLLGTSSYALTASYALNSFGGLTKVQHMTSGSTWCTMSIVNGLIVSII